MYEEDAFSICLAFTLISTFLWGSWANTMKMANTRFELFYYDYTLGVFLFSTGAAIMLGGRFFGKITDPKNFPSCLNSLDSPHVIFAFGAGAIFNLANFLLIAAVEIVGMAIAFPAGIGISLVVGTVVNYFIQPQSSKAEFLFGGLGLACVAVLCNSLAFKFRGTQETTPIKESPKNLPKHQKSLYQSIMLCVVCGFLMGSWSPFVSKSMDILSPYTCFFFYSLAVLITTFPMCYIFSKKSLIGAPFEPSKEYFLGGWKWHILALLGGALWAAGTLLNFIGSKKLGFAPGFAIGQTSPLIAALWGIFLWKEFRYSSSLVITLLLLTFLCYGGAIALIALSV